MSNYPSGMSARDWRHVENPDTMETGEDTCPDGHRILAFKAYISGRTMRWSVCGTCDWSTDMEDE